MKNIIAEKCDRRIFLRDTLLTTALVMSRLPSDANEAELQQPAVSCGTTKVLQPLQSIASVKTGNWSDPGTWGGTIPGSDDTAVISSGHSVFLDIATINAGGMLVEANASLAFDAATSCTIECNRNVVILGILKMRPENPSVNHTLKFIGINENNFAGGGMDVLESDIGLWVMGAGTLDIAGSPKKTWTTAGTDIPKASGSIIVQDAAGWSVGDDIVITPTEAPLVGQAFSKGFDEATITSISGPNINLNKITGRRHPVVNGKWPAEVLNLTRNVRIEGTPSGRSHIFIRSTSRQVIRYAQFRHLGPRKDKDGDGIKELVAGRYGMHFHHCMNGSRGSVVHGNVIRDCGNHAYVPHISHGITFTQNISYNTLETSFWWDPGEPTHDVVYDGNVVALCNYVPGSINMNAEGAPTFSSSGFALNTGDGNVCNNNVVVGGGMGDFADGGAYNWEAVENEGVWTFVGNIAHNNDCGLRVWQNSTRNHVIEEFFAYHNAMGIFHGAYANSYTYNGGILYGNKMEIKAASVNSNRVRVENITFDGAGMVDHAIEVIHSPLPGERPILLRNLTISGCTGAAIIDTVQPEVHSIDIVQCEIDGEIVLAPTATAGETIRVQPKSGQAFQITKGDRQNINSFAPTFWGTGKGLKGEYYNGNNFNNHAFTRIDSNISFSEWSMGVHYAITGNVYSVRWTGKIQPQFTEAITFSFDSGGGHRLWIDNKLVLDDWEDIYPDTFLTTPIELEAGKMYDIKVEYFNQNELTGAGLMWKSHSMPLEYVPQSQLYAEAIVVPDPDSDPDPDTDPDTEPNDPDSPNPSPNDPDHEAPEIVKQTVKTIARDYIEVRSVVDSNYQLFDAGARLLKKGRISAGVNYIYITGVAKGMLFLSILNTPKAFRIVKM